MPATTAPDFYPVAKDLPRVRTGVGVTLELLVLADDGRQCAGIDVESGALVRAWYPASSEEPLYPYDVVEVTLDADFDAVPDPTQPEALVLAAPPEPQRRIAGRRAEKLIRPLVHPRNTPLLGIPGSTVPFYDRTPDHPSIAVVEPEGLVTLWRDRPYLACVFRWHGHDRELPALDRRRAADMDRAGLRRMACRKGDRLLVSLTPPIDGRCHKVVEAILPPP